MIYATLTFWLLMIVFTGVGIYRLWASLGKGAWIHWALLPGTVVSEMSYIFGCLITGGEIRRAKIVPDAGDKAPGAGGPTTEASPKLKHVGPVLASLMSVVACAAAILLVHSLLGGEVMRRFADGGGLLAQASLPRELPTSWQGFWDQVARQVVLLRRMCETVGEVDWLDWRVPLFVYLSTCLAVRLSPAGRPLRPTLGAAVAASLVLAMIGLVWGRFADLIHDIWPLVTYVWTSLLVLLAITLLVRGGVALAGVLAGKDAGRA
jgi:hypothetical protein